MNAEILWDDLTIGETAGAVLVSSSRRLINASHHCRTTRGTNRRWHERALKKHTVFCELINDWSVILIDRITVTAEVGGKIL